MSIIKEIIVGILTGYLALTNFVAVEIQHWADSFSKTGDAPETVLPTDDRLSWLPSFMEGSIPDVLLRSAAYQQAASLGSADSTGPTTADPLEAIVNIFCTFTTDTYVRTTTGTGFFIDQDGVILTNAHVAQFLLFETTNDIGETECVVRNGDPAAPRYLAELLYIPPAWIQQNATVLSAAVPMGTGERDYALLYVTSSVDTSPLPARFPALRFDTSLLPITVRDTSVVAAGYPAENLIRNGPSADLVPQVAETSISELYTFGSNYADVIAIRGSAVGAEGASGGPVLDETGAVIGLIVTRGDDTIDGTGSLRAITLSHIERTLQQETGFSLTQNLSGNLPYRANIFAKTMSPFLLTILQQANFRE